MKHAIAVAPRMIRLPAWPRSTAATLYRIAGVLIAAGLPTLFWTFALVLATKGMGVALGAPALATFGLFVAACCLAGAALVIGSSDNAQGL
jgi:hypothetical protein